MSTMQYPHIVIDEAGTARIGRTRYKVIHLAGEHYHYAWSADELLRQHPDLRPEEVYAALTYFYDHRDDMVAQLDAAAALAESCGPTTSVSREQLLRRERDSQ